MFCNFEIEEKKKEHNFCYNVFDLYNFFKTFLNIFSTLLFVRCKKIASVLEFMKCTYQAFSINYSNIEIEILWSTKVFLVMIKKLKKNHYLITSLDNSTT